MSRSLRYDIPGPDWRVALDELRAGGVRAAFATTLPDPARLVVEIGFGRGEFLTALAKEDPAAAFLGVEVSAKRVLKTARRLARSGLANVRLVEAPGEVMVREVLDPGGVDVFWINYPDPWPKKRHHKRRLVTPGFVADLGTRLAPGGRLEIATDHVDYAEAIDAALRASPDLRNRHAPHACVGEVPGRMATAYELEWRKEGRPLHYFSYERPLEDAE